MNKVVCDLCGTSYPETATQCPICGCVRPADAVTVNNSGEQTGYEGCLSVPGKSGMVTRPNYVKAVAYNENMEEFTIEGTELMARAICHELDHLDGILYKDVADGPLHEAQYEDDDEE